MQVRKPLFEKINNRKLDQVFREKMKNLKAYGLIEEDGKIMKLTALGAFVADEVVEQFNSDEYIPFARERYAEGKLNPYLHNTPADAFGERRIIQ
jgi:oxygen-independent coproporphyrinogen-3 oxidase